MKTRLLKEVLAPAALVMGMVILANPVQAALSSEIVALHWHPETAVEARRKTLAAAAWLEDESAEVSNWQSAVRAQSQALVRHHDQIAWDWTPLADGLFAWLVQARDHNLAGAGGPFPDPEFSGFDRLVQDPAGAGRIGRQSWIAAFEAPTVWRKVRARLEAIETVDADKELKEFWEPLLIRRSTRVDAPAQWSENAATQASRVLALASAQGVGERSELISEILFDQAQFKWRDERILEALWLVFEGLARLVHATEPAHYAVRYQGWLETLSEDEVRVLRRIDIDLPIIVALLTDAAGYLAGDETAAGLAVVELADAYARLALFAPDMAFYLDQPVRSGIRQAVANCNSDPLLMGPLPRELFERCVESLLALHDRGLATDELVGGAHGPFAPEFLRRELGLVSWQRAAYLDGHLGWMLDAPCESPAWTNVLEWSLMIEHLVSWVPRRPVFFAGPRWQDDIESIRSRALQQAQVRTDWIDCLTGHGRERRDPVLRLLEHHERALSEVNSLLTEASDRFYQELVRPGADIDFDGPADQVTAYRPEGLMLGPCPQADTCGARVELPVSRALLGLFPNAYLLADQIGLGRLDMCYDQVRWVDRQSGRGRKDDARVARYSGRLSFDLVGTFDNGDDAETVFRYRFTAKEPNHYLFAADDPEVLALECPRELVGTSVASTMPNDRPGLVPNRLTYFVSAPTTPEAQLTANWDRGAEWRDWFITGDRVDVLEAVDGQALEVIVQAQLSALSARRERNLAAALINPVRARETDELSLAMARVADATAMLRRTVEIHYPRVIRHHEPVRRMLTGEAGLMTRDRVRLLRDSGVAMLQVPQIGLQRLTALHEHWLELPVALRESGQRPPEVDYGLDRLDQLLRISRYLQADVSAQEAQ